MRLFVRYFPVFVTPLSLTAALAWGGWWTLLPAFIIWGALPVLDSLVGLDRSEHDDGGQPALLRALPRVYALVHVALLSWGLVRVNQCESPIEITGFILAMGIAGGVAIAVAHEMMHRKPAVDQRLAELLMASTTYTHFCVEHVSGHHKNVSTPVDPASARFGESLYGFLPRTIVGGWRSAWGLEAGRAARAGASAYDPRHNRLVVYALVQLALFAALLLAFGPIGLVAFLGQSAIAVGLLEVINYIEHYGLSRQRLPSGAFERVRPEHSWNASHRVSNAMIFNLARHSDHHANVGRSYHELRHMESAPQLPSGYPTMILIAIVPPLWFRVMDPMVEAWNARGEAAA